MKLYCLCQITGDVPKGARDSQGFGPADNQVFGAPNRVGPITSSDEKYRPVMLTVPMRVVQMGVHQKVTERVIPNVWIKNRHEAVKEHNTLKRAMRHYPNVDVLECPVCHARVCIEG